MATTKREGNGIGIGGVLFIVFLVLKLVHVIHWSWWWVTIPLWGPLGLTLIFFTFGLAIAALFIKAKK